VQNIGFLISRTIVTVPYLMAGEIAASAVTKIGAGVSPDYFKKVASWGHESSEKSG
jgi:hypothetical protein